MPTRAVPLVLALGLALLPAPAARATTVVAPTFERLVDAAAQVAVADVLQVTPRAGVAPDGRRIILTTVAFRTVRRVKGDPAATFSIEFLGGTLGDDTMEVVGAPRWVVGDRDVLFIASGRSRLSPLVGLMYGRVRVRVDAAGVQTVATHAGDPITAVDHLWSPARERNRGNARPISLEAFLGAVEARVRASAAR